MALSVSAIRPTPRTKKGIATVAASTYSRAARTAEHAHFGSHVRHTVSSGTHTHTRGPGQEAATTWRRSARGRQDPDLFRLRYGVRLHRARAGVLRREGLHRAPAMHLVPR